MADGDLRDLERRFAATRRVEDEVEWLRARVRAGDLQQERLELAAYCGHEAARRLEASEALEAGVSWYEFISGFELGRDWGNVVRVRVGVAIASLSLAPWLGLYPEDEVLPGALSDLERWVLGAYAWRDRDDLLQSAMGVREELNARWQGHDAVNPFGAGPSLAELSGRPLWRVYLVLMRGYERQFTGRTTKGLVEAAFLAAKTLEWCEGLSEAESQSFVADRVRAEVVAWALGYGDPVRRRVEADG